MNRRSFLLAGGTLALAGVSGCVGTFFAPVSAESYGETRVSPGTVLRLSNRNGPVTLSRVEGDAVTVRAQLRSREGQKGLDRVSVESYVETFLDGTGIERSRMVVESTYRRFADGRDPSVSVDLDVGLPAFVDVEAVETRNGDVRATGLTAIRRASTRNGVVDVSFDQLGDDAEFESVNGDVVVRVPGSIAANVDLRTVNGRARVVDLPLDATNEGDRRIAGTVGGGGPVLRLRTTNGDVTLRRA